MYELLKRLGACGAFLYFTGGVFFVIFGLEGVHYNEMQTKRSKNETNEERDKKKIQNLKVSCIFQGFSWDIKDEAFHSKDYHFLPKLPETCILTTTASTRLSYLMRWD